MTSETFGLLIAYLIPGLIVLWGLSRFVPELASWTGTSAGECQTFGGFLNLTVASVGAGLTASTVRWLVIDPIHYWTGVPRPAWNMADFHQRTEGLQVLIESYYRYHQFYALWRRLHNAYYADLPIMRSWRVDLGGISASSMNQRLMQST